MPRLAHELSAEGMRSYQIARTLKELEQAKNFRELSQWLEENLESFLREATPEQIDTADEIFKESLGGGLFYQAPSGEFKVITARLDTIHDRAAGEQQEGGEVIQFPERLSGPRELSKEESRLPDRPLYPEAPIHGQRRMPPRMMR